MRTLVERFRRVTGSALVAALATLTVLPAMADDAPAGSERIELEQTDARTDVPLEGFLPFAPEPGSELEAADSEFPYSMEWFYLPLSDVVTGPGEYNWSAVEAQLNAIGERGHQSVIRFYLDYPGRPTGVPAHLLGPGGIDQSRSYDYHGNAGLSFSPDYDDPRVLGTMTDFITAFGEQYDGDPRLGYVTTGLLGFWGEQHTYPMNGLVEPSNPEGIDWMPSTATQEAVYATWDEAFDETRLLARYPATMTAGHGIGYHDDSFAYSTTAGTDWHFLALMEAEGLSDHWEQAPIGGELYPPLQECVFSQPLNCSGAEQEIVDGRDFDVPRAIEESHATWIINHRGYTVGYQGADRERALDAHARLGSDLSAVAVTTALSADSTALEVTLEVANRGVAPFYYDWPAEFALLDQQGEARTSVEVDPQLSLILPGDVREISASIPVDQDSAGLALAFRIPNVMETGAPLRLANSAQDALAPGYLSLTTVPPMTVPTNDEELAPGPPSAPEPLAGDEGRPSHVAPPAAEDAPVGDEPVAEKAPAKPEVATSGPSDSTQQDDAGAARAESRGNLARTGAPAAVPIALAAFAVIGGLTLIGVSRWH